MSEKISKKIFVTVSGIVIGGVIATSVTNFYSGIITSNNVINHNKDMLAQIEAGQNKNFDAIQNLNQKFNILQNNETALREDVSENKADIGRLYDEINQQDYAKKEGRSL